MNAVSLKPNGSTHPAPPPTDADSADRLHIQSLIDRLAGDRLIVQESAGQYAFRHSLTRDAVYATLLRAERQGLHRNVAETIEQLFPEKLETYVADLAYHFHEAAQWDKDIEYSGRAGAKAQAMYAPREAIQHCTQAIEAARHAGRVPPPGLFRTRGQAHDLIGEFDLALADFESARASAQVLADRQAEWQSLMDVGFLWAARDYGRTGEFLREALEVARAIGDPATLAHTLNRVGNWYLNIEHLQQALRYHLEALDIFQAQADRAGLAETYDLLGITSFLVGDLIRGGEYYLEAIRLFRELGDQPGLSSALANHAERGLPMLGGYVAFPFVPLAEVTAEVREAISVAAGIGWRSGEAYARLNLGDCLLAGGDYAGALAEAERGRDIAAEIGHQQWFAYAHGNLSLIYQAMLAGAQAREFAEKAFKLSFEIGSLNFIRFFGNAVVEACLLQDYPSRAEFVLGLVLGRPELIGGVYPRLEQLQGQGLTTSLSGRLCYFALARLALARGLAQLALDYADDLLATAMNRAEFGEASLGLLMILRSDAMIALSRADEVGPSLTNSLADAQQRGARSQEWQLHAALSRLYRALGQAEAAAQATEAGDRIVNELALNVPAGELRENFLRRVAAMFAR